MRRICGGTLRVRAEIRSNVIDKVESMHCAEMDGTMQETLSVPCNSSYHIQTYEYQGFTGRGRRIIVPDVVAIGIRQNWPDSDESTWDTKVISLSFAKTFRKHRDTASLTHASYLDSGPEI